MNYILCVARICAILAGYIAAGFGVFFSCLGIRCELTCTMVLILDGNSVAHAYRKKGLFGEKKIFLMTASDLINALALI